MWSRRSGRTASSLTRFVDERKVRCPWQSQPTGPGLQCSDLRDAIPRSFASVRSKSLTHTSSRHLRIERLHDASSDDEDVTVRIAKRTQLCLAESAGGCDWQLRPAPEPRGEL